MIGNESKIEGIIYLITNKVNGKIYIGQTKNTLKRRWYEHCNKAKRNPTKHFEHAINKYGPNNFTVIQIDSANSFKELDKKEDCWIEYYKASDPKMVYNSLKGGQMRFEYLTKEKQQEAVEKLCLANGRGWFDVYDYRDGNLVGSWCNTYEAGRFLDVSQQNICHYLSGRGHSCGKYIFVLQKEKNYEKVKNKRIAKAKSINYHPMRCFDLKGTFLGKFDNCAEASKILGFNSDAGYRVLSGKGNKTNNFILIKEEEYDEEVLKNKLDLATRIGKYEWFVGFDLLTGKQIGRWSSGKHACKELNLSPAALRLHLIPNKKEKRGTRVKQYIFVFEHEDIENTKKQRVQAIVNCKGVRTKNFVKNNPSILEMLK